jgi:hypothetical protein
MSWNETMDLFEQVGVLAVPILFIGVYDKDEIQEAVGRRISNTSKHEGYVIRTFDSFHYDDFQHNVAKWVRPDHVQTDEHWMHGEIKKNKLLTNDLIRA